MSREESAISIRDWVRKIANANGHLQKLERYLREEELSQEEIDKCEQTIAEVQGAKQMAQERLRSHALRYIQKFLIEVGNDLLAEAQNEKQFEDYERIVALVETVDDIFELQEWFRSLESEDPT